jgi:hypothetical protein
MPHIDLSFSTSAFTIVLLLVAATVVSYFIYRFTVPPVATVTRVVLMLLRALTLSFLLLFLFEPLLRLVFTSQKPPVVGILVDESTSMAIKDKTGDRREELRKVLSSPQMKSISNHGEALYYTFGSAVKQVDPGILDSLGATEDATDISSALRTLASDRESRNVDAAVLISDGSYNLGQNPIYAAEQLDLPVYTIGIGDSSEQKDVLVTRIAANDLVYTETQAPVDVTIKSSGLAGEHVEVTLNEGTRMLDRKTITLGQGTREYPVSLSYTPEGDGLKKYTVRISALPGELTTSNNFRSFFARVLKSKLRVFILAGSPSPDLSVLKQTLSEDRNVTVQSLTQKLPDGFYEGSLSSQLLDSADCIMTIDFPTSSTRGTSLDMIAASIQQQRKPLFFIGGKQVDWGKLQALASILPFRVQGISTEEEYVFFQPAETQRQNPILSVPQAEDLSPWNKLPPIFKTETSFAARPEATVLGYSRVQGVLLKEPLMLTRNVNRQKSLIVLGYGLWRWRLMTQGTPETERLLSTFLVNGVKWLTTREDSKPVMVTTTKESYTQGEPVEFVGQVYDASAQPVDNAQLRVMVREGGREFPAVLRSIGSGRYEGSIDGLSEGDYTFKALAVTDGQQLGEDNGRFAVGGLNLEFQDTRMNSSLLRQIAARTGGRYYSPDDFSTLVDDITTKPSFTPRKTLRATAFELWNWQYSLAVLILLFGAEWFIRKRSGML